MGSELVERLCIKSGMMQMGEKIAWGSDTALMDEAAAALSAQEEQIERLRKELTYARPIITSLIASGFNVDTWKLNRVLEDIDAALEGSKRDG